MNWDALGALAELLGAVAVLATLVYVAVQVRHSRNLLEENRKFALSSSFQARVAFRHDAHYLVAQNQDLSRLSVAVGFGETSEMVASFDKLSPEEKFRFSSLHRGFALNVENTVFQYGLGLIDESTIAQVRQFTDSNYGFWKEINILSPRIIDWYENDGGA